MERSDLATSACVNGERQFFPQTGHGNLVMRKFYSRDRLRLLRCCRCGEEFPSDVLFPGAVFGNRFGKA